MIITSCRSLGYDPHDKPIPKQEGRYFSVVLKEKIDEDTTIIPLYRIEKPVNNESGWDSDDVVLVFRSPIITENVLDRITWGSDSCWTKSRLKTLPPFGYGGAFSAKVVKGEVRVYCGSRGQFLVNLKSIYLVIKR